MRRRVLAGANACDASIPRLSTSTPSNARALSPQLRRIQLLCRYSALVLSFLGIVIWTVALLKQPSLRSTSDGDTSRHLENLHCRAAFTSIVVKTLWSYCGRGAGAEPPLPASGAIPSELISCARRRREMLELSTSGR